MVQKANNKSIKKKAAHPFLKMLEDKRYISAHIKQGKKFEDLIKLGFKFETVQN